MSTLLQGTEEWLKIRQNGIGASDAAIIMGMSPWKTRKDLWAEKVGLQTPTEASWFMQRGNELEPYARELYISETNIHVEPKVIFHPTISWIFASLDGIDEEGETIVEIKCPGKKDHALAKEGKIPEKYYPQLQHQMVVCNLKEAHYFSFDGQSGVLLTIKRDDLFIDRMMEEESRFWQCVENFITPD